MKLICKSQNGGGGGSTSAHDQLLARVYVIGVGGLSAAKARFRPDGAGAVSKGQKKKRITYCGIADLGVSIWAGGA